MPQPTATETAILAGGCFWGMEDLIFDEKTLELDLHGFGFYHEEYEKVDGVWKFVFRQLRRTFVLNYRGENAPPGVRPATQRA